jgi:hypothetical protein
MRNNRTTISGLFVALAIGLSIQVQAQGPSGTSVPPAGTPSATPPQMATPTPPLTPPPPQLNSPGSTLQGANVPGQSQEVPGGVSSQGRVGTTPNLCPCSVTTPNTRAPVGGCSC